MKTLDVSMFDIQSNSRGSSSKNNNASANDVCEIVVVDVIASCCPVRSCQGHAR
jgi:hypothetical protein